MNTNSGKIFALGQTGNKLFQLAFAFTTKGCDALDITFSRNGKNLAESVQLESLANKLGVKLVCDSNTKRTSEVIHNLCIRFSSKNRPGVINSAIRKFLQICYFKLAQDSQIYSQLILTDGSGNLPTVPESPNYAVLGYVQNANLLRDVDKKEAFTRAIEETTASGKLHDEAIYSDKTVLLQIRLGDYLKDKKIGVCQPEYYALALETLDVQFGIEHIHLYSNDSELAMKYIPDKFRGKVKIVGHETETPLQTINQMRSYSKYVISNSTFGWWGAFLSKHTNPMVYAPDPWFGKLEEPIGLIPKTWKRIPSALN